MSPHSLSAETGAMGGRWAWAAGSILGYLRVLEKGGTIYAMNAERNPVGWFEIYVDDMARAQRFYETVFQMKLQALESPAIKMLAFPMKGDLPGCTGALVQMSGGRPSGNGVIIYFTCMDCAEEAKRAAQNGGKVFKEKFSIGQYGFIALVHDSEGNMIGLHSRQ